MSSLPQTGHEHHERIREHVDRLPGLADLLEQRPTPTYLGPRFTAELEFITGTLWPHVQVVEDKVYPQLERLMQNRHSVTPLKREHAELASLIESLAGYVERVEAGPLNPTDAFALRRAILRFYGLVKMHLGEEAEYLRVLEGNLSTEEQESLAG